MTFESFPVVNSIAVSIITSSLWIVGLISDRIAFRLLWLICHRILVPGRFRTGLVVLGYLLIWLGTVSLSFLLALYLLVLLVSTSLLILGFCFLCTPVVTSLLRGALICIYLDLHAFLLICSFRPSLFRVETWSVLLWSSGRVASLNCIGMMYIGPLRDSPLGLGMWSCFLGCMALFVG